MTAFRNWVCAINTAAKVKGFKNAGNNPAGLFRDLYREGYSPEAAADELEFHGNDGNDE